MPGRHELPEREQAKTGFTTILQNLLDALPGAAGAALADDLGECVDYAGVLDPFEIKIAAAHLQIELRSAQQALIDRIGEIRTFTVSAQKRTYSAHHLLEGYILILIFTSGATLQVSSRAIAQAEYDVRVEGGWDPPPEMERWIHIQVDARPHDRWRPRRVRIANAWFDVDVIGAVVGLADGEKGFRVRTSEGAEMTLVRERQGRWYADMRY